jgi:hypothetical protein
MNTEESEVYRIAKNALKDVCIKRSTGYNIPRAANI